MLFNNGKNKIPAEICLKIFLFCVSIKSPEMFLKLMLVCKSWRTTMNENCFWRYAYKNEFYLPLDHNTNAKKKYITLFCQIRFDSEKIINFLKDLHGKNDITITGCHPEGLCCFHDNPSIVNDFMTRIDIDIGQKYVYLNNFDKACAQENMKLLTIDSNFNKNQIQEFISKFPNKHLKNFFQVVFAINETAYVTGVKSRLETSI